ncbi:MAG: terpene cyclase/mutase family protein [Planctomycetes bacterium]|nr:terpene cyclase/mutase family protein [Planctomycetota bacterium]
MAREAYAPADTHVHRPWENEPTFQEILNEQLRKAPWLLISLAGHAVVFLLIFLVMKLDTDEEEPPQARIQAAPPQREEQLEEEVIEEVKEEEIEQTEDVEEVVEESDNDMETAEEQGEEGESESYEGGDYNFEGQGLGGARGGKRGGRFGGKKKALGSKGGKGTEGPVMAGLKWLFEHQDDDGKWDADEFDKHCQGDRCEDPGGSLHDTGLTGLALLAFLGDGHHPNRKTRYQRTVKKGIAWLLSNQDDGGEDDGLIGGRSGHNFIYNHALGTLALCEAFLLSRQEQLRVPTQRAVQFILRARNPYKAWRYAVPPNGENDSSVTGWMIFVLKTAEDAGLDIDKQAYEGALALFNELTDPNTGRCGYMARGENPARPEGMLDRFPAEASESLTAVSLLCRIFMGERGDKQPLIGAHADLLLEKLPKWSEDGSTNDMYYWYYGAYAMMQMGGKHWKRWNDEMKPALINNQRQEKEAHNFGSWDPIGPWGHEGGRVYSTAICVLCLEVYYRYAQLSELEGTEHK